MNRNHIVLELERQTVLSLHDSRGATVHCLSGSLWITQDQDASDFVLRPGEWHRISRNGTTLVQAMDASRIALEGAVQLFRRAA